MSKKITEFRVSLGGSTRTVPIKFDEVSDRFEATFLGSTLRADSVKELKVLIKTAAAEDAGISWSYGWLWHIGPSYRTALEGVCTAIAQDKRELHSAAAKQADGSPIQTGEVWAGPLRRDDRFYLPWQPDPTVIVAQYKEILGVLESLAEAYRASLVAMLDPTSGEGSGDQDRSPVAITLRDVEAIGLRDAAIAVLRKAILALEKLT